MKNFSLRVQRGTWVILLCSCVTLSFAKTKNEMKELKVKKIEINSVKAEALSALLDKEEIQYYPLNTVNWAELYSYCPDVFFRIAYTDNAILLNYKVKEASVRARYGEYNGRVWTDSCVEFFSVPGEDDVYYNLECNCIGTLLLGAGSGRGARERATACVLDKVDRWSSLGNQTFEERVGDVQW